MNPHQRPDDPVRHVILLLFENRSFDHMLGSLTSVYPGLEGVDPAKPRVNRAAGKDYPQAPTRERQMDLDPRHTLEHVLRQLADHNGGFVADFVQSYPNSSPEQRQLIMAYFAADRLPALHRLARDFLVCDHWFASLPGPTWPNRLFALSGTSQGRADMPGEGGNWFDLSGWLDQDQVTIFDRLSEKGISWKAYFHDIPQSVCLAHQRRPENLARYFFVEQFYRDTRGSEAAFPAFSLVEPDYCGRDENDGHPPFDIFRSEKLLADVYNAIRANEDLWQSTLLVVLFDEHGGFYDHVAPPAAEPPSPPRPDWDYRFDRLGVRVPALLVSPHVARDFASTPLDHTSLLKYLIEKWDLGPLGNRTAHAASVGPLIRGGPPRTDTVARIEISPDDLRPPRPELEAKNAAYLSEHQQALALLGRGLHKELLREAPVLYALLAWGLEMLSEMFAKLLGRPGSHWAYRRSQAHWLRYHHHRRGQAVPRLAQVIRDSRSPTDHRHHAAEALGGVVGQAFHLASDPSQAAAAWLDQHGL